ncbi:MAG: hypothetical protein SGBAC_003487, partial [Bacillariaceae sp.]
HQQGGIIKNDAANHIRSESYETSITCLSINESHSADWSANIEEFEASKEELSPHHMICYGKSVLELEAGECATGATKLQLQETKSDAENSFEEGLSCIMEESSRETQSLDSFGISSREASPNPSPKAATLLCQRIVPSSSEQHENNTELLATKKRFSQINTIPPRMIQMDGSILSYDGGSWRDFANTSFSRRECMKDSRVAMANSFSSPSSSNEVDDSVSIFDSMSHKAPAVGNSSPSKVEDEPDDANRPHIEGGSSLVNLLDREERSTSTCGDEFAERKGLLKPEAKKKTHRRSSTSFRRLFFRNATRNLTPPLDDYAPAPVCELLASALSDTSDDYTEKDLDQVLEITLWSVADGTTRTRFEV